MPQSTLKNYLRESRLFRDRVLISVFIVVAVVLGLICVGVWMLSSWWTRKTMREGAQLVIEATGDNDQWDAKKTQSFAQLAKTMYAQSGRALAAQETPMLPLNQEGGSWLPEPRDFGGEEGEWEDVEVDANGQPKWQY